MKHHTYDTWQDFLRIKNVDHPSQCINRGIDELLGSFLLRKFLDHFPNVIFQKQRLYFFKRILLSYGRLNPSLLTTTAIKVNNFQESECLYQYMYIRTTNNGLLTVRIEFLDLLVYQRITCFKFSKIQVISCSFFTKEYHFKLLQA